MTSPAGASWGPPPPDPAAAVPLPPPAGPTFPSAALGSAPGGGAGTPGAIVAGGASRSRGNRTRMLIIVLTLLNTVFAAVLAGLQIDASIRGDDANRESQSLAVSISGELTRNGIETGYQTALLTRVISSTQEALTLEFSALQRQTAGDLSAAAELRAQAAISRARAARAQQMSLFFQDPRYRAEGGGLPKVQLYEQDRLAHSQAMLVRQNAASDTYAVWNGKSDTFVAILTVLAVAFVLLGIGQATRRTGAFFAGVGALLMSASLVWTLVVVAG